jgi:hypothetical protein
MKQEAGSGKQEAGSRKEAGGKRQRAKGRIKGMEDCHFNSSTIFIIRNTVEI